VSRLLEEPPAVRRRVVRELWRASSGSRRGIDAGHVEAVLRLLRRGRPGRATLPRGLEARCAYGLLEVGPPRGSAPRREPVEVPGPGRYRVPGGVLEVTTAEGAGVAWPLWLRSRRPGDRFRPAGAPGSKKLKAWLIDRKVPREERDRLLLLADSRGRVLAIPELGVRSEPGGVSVRFVPA